MPSELKTKSKVKARPAKRSRRATGVAKTTANGRAKAGSPRRKLTNARLRKLAAKNRPPQTWYETEVDLF